MTPCIPGELYDGRNSAEQRGAKSQESDLYARRPGDYHVERQIVPLERIGY
jgi:hypothetical protein